MAKKLYDLAAAVSTYTMRNGQEKTNWENVGAIYENEKGNMFLTLKPYINFAALPRREGSDNLIINVFAPRTQNAQNNNYGGNNNTQNNYYNGNNNAQNNDDLNNFDNNPYNQNNAENNTIPF